MDKKPKKRTQSRDRIPLSESNMKKLDGHIEQVKKLRPGVEFNRRDYVAYIIEDLPDQISTSETKRLADKFFDKKKFLKYLLTKVDESSEFDLSPYMSVDKSSPKRPKKKPPSQSQKATDTKEKLDQEVSTKSEGFQSEKQPEIHSHSSSTSLKK